jgi:hypothetical protein
MNKLQKQPFLRAQPSDANLPHYGHIMSSTLITMQDRTRHPTRYVSAFAVGHGHLLKKAAQQSAAGKARRASVGE